MSFLLLQRSGITKDIMLGKISQAQKDKYTFISYVET
jgi:hypothetical protein